MTTIFLAQAIGILFIIVGLSLALERKMIMGIFKELFQHRVLTYMWGVFMLMVSIVIILGHNIWTGVTELAVTILGWYLFLEAIVYIFMPQKYFTMMSKEWSQKKTVFYSLAGVFLLVGLYFFSYGFLNK